MPARAVLRPDGLRGKSGLQCQDGGTRHFTLKLSLAFGSNRCYHCR